MISDATLRRVLPRSAVDLVGDLVRAILWGLAIVVWLSFVQVYARLWRLGLTEPGSDFTIFYYTVRMIADGLPMYGVPPESYGIGWNEGLGNLNPPHVQVLTRPLALLTYGQAFVVWTAASFAAALGSIVLAWRAVGLRTSPPHLVGIGALIVSSAAFTTVVSTWELTFLLMVPFTLAWAAARAGRWTRAGAWLGVCASIKLFFLLFLPWFVLRRKWRALAASMASGVASVLVGASVYGPSTYLEWIRHFEHVGWEWLHMNASWPGFVARTLRGHEGMMAPVWEAVWLERPVALGGAGFICVAGLLAAARATAPRPHSQGAPGAEAAASVTLGVGPPSHAASAPRRSLGEGGDLGGDLAWLLLLATALLASPLGWVYYLPLALGPLLGVLQSGVWKQLPRGTLPAIGIAAVGLWVPQELAAARQPSALATVTLASSYFWGTAALWIGTVVLAYRRANAAAIAALRTAP